MSKVFVNIGLSLDGYMAPEGMTMGKPEYKNWDAKWGALMAWIPSRHTRALCASVRAAGAASPCGDVAGIGCSAFALALPRDRPPGSWPSRAPLAGG